MTGSIESLVLAVACFVGGHFALSSLPVRRRLIGVLGELPFRALYSLAMLGALVWAVRAYGAAPYSSLWTAEMGLTHLPVILMIFACILAVAAGEERPVARNGAVVVATIMSVTLTCDHRVVDGATGARWLQVFKAMIETPATMLV